MKKILMILLCLVMSGCGRADKPATDSVIGFIETVKTQDWNKLDKYRTEPFAPHYADLNEGSAIRKELMKSMRSLEYEIIEENIIEDKATIKVIITTYDYVEIINKFKENIDEELLSSYLNSDIKVDSSIVEKLKLVIDDVGKNNIYHVNVRLVKANGTWLIDDNEVESIEFMEALTGNITDVLRF